MNIPIEFDISIDVSQEETTGLWVAHCPMFNLYSQGETREQAKSAIQGAIQMYLTECNKRNIKFQAVEKKKFLMPGEIPVITITFEDYKQNPSAAWEYARNGSSVVIERDGKYYMTLGACIDVPGSWDDIN
jgi:predicted RNase H-like HicB family nuclease